MFSRKEWFGDSEPPPLLGKSRGMSLYANISHDRSVVDVIFPFIKVEMCWK